MKINTTKREGITEEGEKFQVWAFSLPQSHIKIYVSDTCTEYSFKDHPEIYINGKIRVHEGKIVYS